MSFRTQKPTVSLPEVLQREEHQIISFINFTFTSYPLKRQELKTQLNEYLTALNKTIFDCVNVVNQANGYLASQLEVELELSRWANGEFQQQVEQRLASAKNSISRFNSFYLTPAEFKREEECLAAEIQASRNRMDKQKQLGQLYLATKTAKRKTELAVTTFQQLEAQVNAEAASKPRTKTCTLS